MSKPKTLGTVIDAYEELDGEVKRDADGKVVNRSTAYDVVRRLPDHLKIRIGKSLRVHLPKLREWRDGQDRAA
jgi:hypothetical protein